MLRSVSSSQLVLLPSCLGALCVKCSRWLIFVFPPLWERKTWLIHRDPLPNPQQVDLFLGLLHLLWGLCLGSRLARSDTRVRRLASKIIRANAHELSEPLGRVPSQDERDSNCSDDRRWNRARRRRYPTNNPDRPAPTSPIAHSANETCGATLKKREEARSHSVSRSPLVSSDS